MSDFCGEYLDHETSGRYARGQELTLHGKGGAVINLWIITSKSQVIGVSRLSVLSKGFRWQYPLVFPFINMQIESREETPLLLFKDLNHEEISLHTYIQHIANTDLVTMVSFRFRNLHSFYTPNCQGPPFDGTHCGINPLLCRKIVVFFLILTLQVCREYFGIRMIFGHPH